MLGVSHLGETLQVAVRIGEDATFLSRMPAPTAPEVGVDDEVRCVWNPADARLFAADGIPTTATHVITLPKDGGR
ncbi:TOBE domain-containing protein [Microbacterium maritypicum]|uniref:TOBE domain-containing protein n=1 Tax=Microbacterium maritypicum TaxID=33918 RepID=UPI00296E9441|nr:TOBE domain-containing protein [Microbacterium liquefaciens]